MRFVIPGAAVPQGRPRFTRTGHAYTPQKSRDYRARVQSAVRAAMAANAWTLQADTALALVVEEHRAIPASCSRRKQEQARRGELQPTSRPDLDNVIKAIKDALNGLVWRDDAQVTTIKACKFYSDTPCVVVRVNTMD